MATMIPETPPDYDRARVIERPDGFYWQDKDTDQTYGPFATLWEAIEDMKYSADADYDADQALDVQEAEIGNPLSLATTGSAMRVSSTSTDSESPDWGSDSRPSARRPELRIGELS